MQKAQGQASHVNTAALEELADGREASAERGAQLTASFSDARGGLDAGRC